MILVICRLSSSWQTEHSIQEKSVSYHEGLQQHRGLTWGTNRILLINNVMRQPVFIISFDCEGKWGVADNITEYDCHILTNQNLNLAYQRLVDILDKRGLKATFAFVGAFTMSFDEFQANCGWFKDIPFNGKNWLARFRKDMAEKTLDGWLNPIPFEIVKHKQQHEIASHGFTHLPLSKNLISEEAFQHEMKAISMLSEMKGLSFDTFIYPRNLVGYPYLLRAYNFIGYRDSLYGERTRLKRIRYLLDELNIKQTAQVHGTLEENLVKIPPGYFLNWRVHLRRMIPLSIITRRWRHAIEKAIENNEVIHLTSHPQDFIDGDSQYRLFDEILKFVAKKQRNGEILNLTQYEYSNMILKECSQRGTCK